MEKTRIKIGFDADKSIIEMDDYRHRDVDQYSKKIHYQRRLCNPFDGKCIHFFDKYVF